MTPILKIVNIVFSGGEGNCPLPHPAVYGPEHFLQIRAVNLSICSFSNPMLYQLSYESVQVGSSRWYFETQSTFMILQNITDIEGTRLSLEISRTVEPT
jgi:hypothetical protein